MVTPNKEISFEQDAQLLKELLALLEREQAHLVKADVDAIEAILEEKSILLQRLNIATKSRYSALAAKGYESNENGMAAWIVQQSKQDLGLRWTLFQKSLVQAKELNRLNGTLISKHFQRNQELLNHLQGNSTTDSVYGSDGQAKTKTTKNRSGLVV